MSTCVLETSWACNLGLGLRNYNWSDVQCLNMVECLCRKDYNSTHVSQGCYLILFIQRESPNHPIPSLLVHQICWPWCVPETFLLYKNFTWTMLVWKMACNSVLYCMYLCVTWIAKKLQSKMSRTNPTSVSHLRLCNQNMRKWWVEKGCKPPTVMPKTHDCLNITMIWTAFNIIVI